LRRSGTSLVASYNWIVNNVDIARIIVKRQARFAPANEIQRKALDVIYCKLSNRRERCQVERFDGVAGAAQLSLRLSEKKGALEGRVRNHQTGRVEIPNMLAIGGIDDIAHVNRA